MDTNYTTQDRGDKNSYDQYIEAMDTISVEKVASASVFFENREGNTIVDVGMASGTSTAILAQLFPNMKIEGVDINAKMVEMAKKMHQYHNLTFKEDDGETLQQFELKSIAGFFNCSAIHHITSYNGYDKNKAINTLKRQVDLLQNKGILVVRDFLKPAEQEVIVELSSTEKPDRPSDADLFVRFAQTARSLAPLPQQGFPILELPSQQTDCRRFKAFYTDVVEFVRRKDYFANWDIELQEEYGYFTQQEFEEIFQELGLRVILSAPIYNQWIINHRYKNQFHIYDLSGKEMGFPPTNYLIAGEKVEPNEGKQIQLLRYLPNLEQPFIKLQSYINTHTHEVYDLVERPNNVIDIIPYIQCGNEILIVAKHGYPRPLANVSTDSPVLDGKHYSGYISEGISIAEGNDATNALSHMLGIDCRLSDSLTQALTYYTSAGGINERVASKLVKLHTLPSSSKPIEKIPFDLKSSAYIHSYNALQLLNTAQTGALVEARLELNIYNLLFKLGIALPKWLGEKLNIKSLPQLEATAFTSLISSKRQDYIAHHSSANFLTTRRAYFSEKGIDGSSAILEFVYPSVYSSNTLVTLPVFRNEDQLWIGLELRSLPVPQLHTNNSLLPTVPARRLPKSIANINDLEHYIQELDIEGAKVVDYAKLGEKYFPSIGITTEQVYPYVVSLSQATKGLKWVKLSELLNNLEKVEDAHLLIALCRLHHMTN